MTRHNGPGEENSTKTQDDRGNSQRPALIAAIHELYAALRKLKRERDSEDGTLAETISKLGAVIREVEEIALSLDQPPHPRRHPGGWAAVFEWQRTRDRRITDRELGRLIGYKVTTIKTARYRLRRKLDKCLPESTPSSLHPGASHGIITQTNRPEQEGADSEPGS